MASVPPPSGPPPGPGASRAEWRAWRRQQRAYIRAQGRGWGGYGPSNPFAWFWGAALIVAGVYFLLQNLGLLNWIRGDVLWPVLLILLGVALLWRRLRW